MAQFFDDKIINKTIIHYAAEKAYQGGMYCKIFILSSYYYVAQLRLDYTKKGNFTSDSAHIINIIIHF